MTDKIDAVSAKYAPPFSLRLTIEERKALDQEADNIPIGAYIRERLFDNPAPRKHSFQQKSPDTQILIELLSKLGKSRIANNLNQLAKASNNGSLPITDETLSNIKTACKDIELMREELIQALKP